MKLCVYLTIVYSPKPASLGTNKTRVLATGETQRFCVLKRGFYFEMLQGHAIITHVISHSATF